MGIKRDFERLARDVERYADELEDAVNDEIDDQLDATKSDAQSFLSANDTNWRTVLYHSMRVTSTERVDGNTKHELTVEAPHGAFVEFGTGIFFDNDDPSRDVPHFSAPDNAEDVFPHIYEWVQTKPIVPRFYSTKRGVAWAISHTIAELGTKSQPYLRPSYAYRKPILKSAVKSTVEKTTRRHF